MKNKPREILLTDIQTLTPKALLLSILLRNKGAVVLPESGSAYIKHSDKLAEMLGFKQYPIIYIKNNWKGIKRPFISWIYKSEGTEGLNKMINQAEIELA